MEPRGATWQHPPTVWPPGWRVEVVAETGSTNADLLAAGAAGAPDRTVRVAAHQTAGRGRLDRRWEAPAGANLLVSLLFRRPPTRPHELTHRVGLAAIEAVRRTYGVQPVLKWPNDLLLDGAKLAGVLAQTATAPDGAPFVVVGIGLNVGWAPPDAARLAIDTPEGVPPPVHPLELLAALLEAFDALPVSSADLDALYRRHLGTIGMRVRVEFATQVLDGVAVDVDPEGRLLVRTDEGSVVRVDTADVVHLRPV